MTVYFCLDDIFEVLALRNLSDNNLDDFIPVYTKAPDCGGHRDDALTLASRPQLLDLSDPKACFQMASLIEDVPLYHINLELMIDEILTQRHHNQIVRNAITEAFGGQALPQTLEDGSKLTADGLEGSLRHPMIGHLDKVTLCKIYLNFLRALPHGHDDYSFERYILGNHSKPYYEQFDGFIAEDSGKVKASILLGFGTRADYDPRQPIENYVDNGRTKAAAMRITEPRELIWAWMEADQYQMRRCHDIDRIMTLRGLPRMPNWVRTDVFNCLEKEAMKQVLSAKLIELDPDLKIAEKQPMLQKSLLLSAKGQIDENLERLLAQTLSPGSPYAGAAEKFFLSAQRRQRESRDI